MRSKLEITSLLFIIANVCFINIILLWSSDSQETSGIQLVSKNTRLQNYTSSSYMPVSQNITNNSHNTVHITYKKEQTQQSTRKSIAPRFNTPVSMNTGNNGLTSFVGGSSYKKQNGREQSAISNSSLSLTGSISIGSSLLADNATLSTTTNSITESTGNNAESNFAEPFSANTVFMKAPPVIGGGDTPETDDPALQVPVNNEIILLLFGLMFALYKYIKQKQNSAKQQVTN